MGFGGDPFSGVVLQAPRHKFPTYASASRLSAVLTPRTTFQPTIPTRYMYICMYI